MSVFSIRTVPGFFVPFLLTWSLYAQPEILFFNRLSDRSELASQSNNKYIFHDSHGYVWISSMHGLTRLAGRTVRFYYHEPDNPNSLADNNIQSRFWEDARGDIWFCTAKAIHRYDRKMDHFHRYELPAVDGQEANNYAIFYLDSIRNALWAGSIGGDTYLMPLDDPNRPCHLGAFPLGYNTEVIKRGDTLSFFTPSSSGLEVLHLRKGQRPDQRSYRLNTQVRNYSGSAMVLANGAQCWIGGKHGLLALDLSTGAVRQIEVLSGIRISALCWILKKGKKHLLVATRDRGMFIVDPDQPDLDRPVFSDLNGQVNPFRPVVSHLYVGPDSTVWFSAHGQGVYFANLRKRKFPSFFQDQNEYSSLERNVRALAQDPSGRLWVRTQSDIQILDERGRLLDAPVQPPASNSPYADEQMLDMHCDREGRIWLTSLDGLHVWEPGASRFELVKPKGQASRAGMFFCLERPDGRLMVSSTHRDHRSLFQVVKDQGRFSLVPALEEGLSFISTLTLFTLSPDGQLIANEDGRGLHFFKEGPDGLYHPDTLLPLSPTVSGFQVVPDSGWIWLATFNGLYKLQRTGGSWKLEKEPSFPGGYALTGILRDAAGHLWLGTQNGLVKYDPANHDHMTYSLSQGLQALEFNISACLRTRDGRLAFGGPNGLNLFRPEAIRPIADDARPVITQVLVEDKEPENLFCQSDSTRNVTRIRKLKMPFSQNTLSFYFAALEYSDPQANTYFYQMENLDENIIQSGTRNYARYADMPAGDYTFVVYANNSDGLLSDQQARMEITILPPFYDTWWFKLLAGLIALSGIFGFFQFRLAQARQKAEYERNVAEIETAVLRLQMNPHFIFNTMNSIGNYVLQNQSADAHDYLGRFSKLMRLILDYAKKPMIEVSEDVALLDQYLYLEQMRLKGKLDYHIDIDPQLDPDEVLIPTMILQPFVENAIWHGIAPKPDGGRIDIRIRQDGEQLVAIVEDNGIGRKARAEQQKGKTQRTSRAIGITERRLDLLESQYQRPTKLEFEDLQTPDGQAVGTRVRLVLPLV